MEQKTENRKSVSWCPDPRRKRQPEVAALVLGRALKKGLILWSERVKTDPTRKKTWKKSKVCLSFLSLHVILFLFVYVTRVIQFSYAFPFSHRLLKSVITNKFLCSQNKTEFSWVRVFFFFFFFCGWDYHDVRLALKTLCYTHKPVRHVVVQTSIETVPV